MAGQRNRLLGNALHQAAVAHQHIGFVINEFVAEAGGQMALGDGEAHGIGDALAQGARGGFNASGVAIFRVARRFRSQLTEIFQILERHVPVAREIEQGIDQHGAVAGGQNETIAIRPVWVAGIEVHELGE